MRFFFIIRSGLCSEKSKKQIKKVLFRNLGTNLSSQSTNKHIYVPGITDNLSKWFFSYVVKVPQRFSNVKRILYQNSYDHAGNIRCYLTCKFFFFFFHASRPVLRVCFFFVMHTILVAACQKCKIFKVYTHVYSHIKRLKGKKTGAQ